MKVILSRKGMDSAAGGIASPVLPDGTLLSFPIPDNMSQKAYSDVYYKGQSMQNIIKQLSPKFNFNKKSACHLDPDIYDVIEGKCDKNVWKPAFGQQGISAMHLDKLEVGIGDIFLFYGMFRKTEYRSDETLCFVRNAPIQHIIYGYMQVGKILQEEQRIKQDYHWHPHSKNDNYIHNRLYIPSSYGTFQYDDSLVLTKQGQNSRQLWALPAFFANDDISISWQGKNRPVMKNGYAELKAAYRGQEFVVTAATAESEQLLSDWVSHIIQKSKKGE